MDQRGFIFVPGIRDVPGCESNWHRKAVTWINTRTAHKAEDLEYFTLAVTRWVGDQSRAEKLARKLAYWRGWKLHLVGHSNGTDVILDGLKQAGWPPIERLELLSPACNPDFESNGLNEAIALGWVKSVRVWQAGRDWALKLAHTPMGKLLGYGDLGLVGPQNQSRPAKGATTVVKRPIGHSGWFSAGAFEETLFRLAEAAGA